MGFCRHSTWIEHNDRRGWRFANMSSRMHSWGRRTCYGRVGVLEKLIFESFIAILNSKLEIKTFGLVLNSRYGFLTSNSLHKNGGKKWLCSSYNIKCFEQIRCNKLFCGIYCLAVMLSTSKNINKISKNIALTICTYVVNFLYLSK